MAARHSEDAAARRVALARSPVVNPEASASAPQLSRRTLFSRLFRMRSARESVSAAASPASRLSTPTHDRHDHDHDHAAATTRVLLEGALVRLSSHKFWHAKATHFVLEEEAAASDARCRVWLKQLREKPRGDEPAHEPLCVIELGESDVVVDISDRYIKHGLELFYRSTAAKSGERARGKQRDEAEELQSIRLSAEDANTHRKWMRVLGSAIARLIDQTKRHYPITPADVEFARGALKSFEPQAVTAIVEAAIPLKASAKVRPMVSNSSSSSSEDDDAESIGENQASDSLWQREDEMRGPEEPETHSDVDDGLGQRTSLSAISDSFSDAWASPHHCNNNSEDLCDENYHERSSNQFEDNADDVNAQDGQFDFGSDLYSSRELAEIALASANIAHVSSNGTDSLDSSPSSRQVEEISDLGNDEDSVSNIADAMATTSLLAEETVATPPVSPHWSSKPLYARHSRPGLITRPKVHSFNANGQVFTLDTRYRLLKSIGNGAYGAVVAVTDSIADMSVAVKKITNIFDDLVDAKRILREVRLLRHFHHKNITQLLDLAPPMTKKSFEDMYIITELMETDLHQVIYSMQPMSDDHVKYFLYQMLCALYHIHSAGVLHRDMKPSNILLNSNCDLKVCDFGLARGGMDPESDAKQLAHPGELTEYVVTRWYRAPEIMLNCLQYTAAIDVWAVGCIFAEMLLREPLFPGNDYMHQLKLIIKFLGTPKQEDIAFIKNVKALRFLTKLSISKPRKWRDIFTGEDLNPLALDLLSQMLIFNPEKRISVEKALQHPYLATFYDAADITRAPPFSFDFDLPDEKLSKEALVDLLCEDVEYFHPALMQAMKHPVPVAAVPMPILPRPPMAEAHNGGNRYFGTTASAS